MNWSSFRRTILLESMLGLPITLALCSAREAHPCTGAMRSRKNFKQPMAARFCGQNKTQSVLSILGGWLIIRYWKEGVSLYKNHCVISGMTANLCANDFSD